MPAGIVETRTRKASAFILPSRPGPWPGTVRSQTRPLSSIDRSISCALAPSASTSSSAVPAWFILEASTQSGMRGQGRRS